jgi:hypothetical protein
VKEEIRFLVGRWKEDLTLRHEISADVFIKKFVSQTQYLGAMKKWTPDLVEEVKGLADGAGIDFDTMVVFQWIDEDWAQGKNVVADRWSGIGVGRRGSRPAMIAQNLDMPGPIEHPVSGPLRDKRSAFTFGSLIMVLSEKPELHVAPGPPHVVPYQVLQFTR